MRSALALTLALVTLGILVDAASAAEPANKGVLSMTPARRTLVGRPPQQLSPTRVSNSTPLGMGVTVFPVLLTQRLDGSFDFSKSPRDLNAAKLVFLAAPNKFALTPGTDKLVGLRWELIPTGKKEADVGLVVQGIPQQKGKGVGSILRLLGINFFTLPGHWTVSGHLTALRGEQAAPRVLRFFPRVKNTGQVHAEPRNGHCKVVRPDQTLVLGGLRYGHGGIVLPGYEREYPILIQKPNVLPAGSYLFKCSQRFGKQRSTKVIPFRLSGPNTLPTASLKLQSISAKGEIGGAAKVGAVVRNVGSKESPAVLRVRLDSLPVGHPPRFLTSGRFPQGTIAANSTKKTSLSLGKLAAGNYRVTVVLTDGHTQIDEKTADFTATKHRGFFDRAKDKWWLLLILLALLLLLWWLWTQRRKRQELEAELVAARQGYVPPAATASPPPAMVTSTPPAPAPAARERSAPPAAAPEPPPEPEPPAPTAAAGRININSASVDELMQLPGVGRRAAERIVSYRDANGPFRSLDDLHAVEGWHAERIRRIAGDASV